MSSKRFGVLYIHIYVCVNGYQPQSHNPCSCMRVQCKNCVFHSGVVMVNQRLLSDYHSLSPTSANDSHCGCSDKLCAKTTMNHNNNNLTGRGGRGGREEGGDRAFLHLYDNLLGQIFKVAWLGVWQINHTLYLTHLNQFFIKIFIYTTLYYE